MRRDSQRLKIHRFTGNNIPNPSGREVEARIGGRTQTGKISIRNPIGNHCKKRLTYKFKLKISYLYIIKASKHDNHCIKKIIDKQNSRD